MTIQTLLLTPWMTPERIISWQRAVVLSFLGKVEVVEEYDLDISAPSIRIKAPAVVRQRKAVSARPRRPAFSREHVFARDAYTCQYCRAVKEPSELNLDHVLPRSRGGITSWENIVTSCYPCNQRKAGRTPEEARMVLAKKPVRPASVVRVAVTKRMTQLPIEWRAYC